MNVERPDRPPEIRCYPVRDQAFRADVQAAIARSRAKISAGHELLRTVREELRERYPGVAIHQQDPLAGLGSPKERWYVYRDGRIA